MNKRLKIAGWHLLGWLIFFGTIILFVTNATQDSHRPQLLALPFLLFAAVYLFLFYINTYVLLPRLYFRQQYVAYFSIAVLLLAAVFLMQPFDKLVASHSAMSFQQPSASPPFNRQGPSPFNAPQPAPPRNYQAPPDAPSAPPGNGEPQGLRRQRLDIVSIVLFMAVWSVGSVLQIFRQWRITEKRAARAEADKANAELSFLKAQINPHFLFNTLNNIYSLATIKSEHTPAAIMKLSNILRYITDDVSADFVPLNMEVDCAQNYIDLQRLRISNKVRVDFSVSGEMSQHQVAPLVFMTFIENAFKYGISNREECTIVIAVKAEEKKVNLFCRNKILRSTVEDSTGVGINNARKRLDYLYPNCHVLLIDSEGGYFTVDLTITT